MTQQGIAKPGGYDFIYFDWDHNKVTCLRNDEPDTFTVPNLRQLINSLEKPTVLIGESTFESYNLQERKDVFDLAINSGHRWYGTPNRATYRWRDRLGWEKTDTIDAYVIRIIAEYPGSLSDLRQFKSEGEKPDGTSKHVYPPMDSNFVHGQLTYGRGNWLRLREISVYDPVEFKLREGSRREDFRVKQAEAMEFRRLDKKIRDARLLEFKREVLRKLDIPFKATVMKSANEAFATEFPALNGSAIWATVFAAKNSDSRDQFEALLGAHAHGAKSLLRSQFYFWGWSNQGKGPMTKGVSLSEYRKQVRRLGALVKKYDLTV